MPFRRTSVRASKGSGFYLPKAFRVTGSRSTGGPTDPNFSSVSLLLHMDGSNGSTTFTDASSNNLTVTVNNSTQISTARSKWGGASGLFAGAPDRLEVTIPTALGTGAWTLESWVYITSRPVFTAVAGIGDYRFASGAVCYLTTAGYMAYYSELGGVNIVGTTVAALNTWHHVAWVQNGSTLTQYLNGTQDGSATNTNNLTETVIRIGGDYYNGIYGSGGGDIRGNLDDFRLTRGVARYTAYFTPPTAPFPDS